MAGAISVNPLSGMWDSYRSTATTPLSGRLNVECQTIDEVLTDPNATRKSGFTDYVKKGHAWSLFNAGVGGLFAWLSSRLESGFWKVTLGFFSVTNFLSAATQIIVATFCTNPEEEKMKQLIPTYITKEEPSLVLDDVILNPDHETEIKLQVEEARKRGVVLNIYGTIGIGKTMTGRAMAGEIVKSGLCKKAQFWYGKDELLKVDAVDHFGGPVTIMGYTLIGGETIAQRVERVVANALAHYKKTGEYVVIGLDEAHVLLEGHESRYSRRSSTKATDRPAIIQAFAKMVDKIQGKNGDCKGIVLMLMSNSAGNKFKFLERRMPNLEYKRPNAALRERFLKVIIPRILTKYGISETVSSSDYFRLAAVGTENIFQKYYASHVYDIAGVETDHNPDYVKAQKDELKNFDLLHFDAIEKAVDKAAFDIKNGRGSGTFTDRLEEKLMALTQSAASDKKAIEDELKDKAGDSHIISWSFDD